VAVTHAAVVVVADDGTSPVGTDEWNASHTVADGSFVAAKASFTATDKVLGRSSSGSGNGEEITLTAAGRALIDDADAAAQRTTLGLGTLATQSGTFSGTSSGTNTGDQTRASLGAAAVAVRPALTPATPTDDFDAALSGWTAVSGTGSFSLTKVFTQAVDGSQLWLPYAAQHGYIYQSTTNVDQEWQVGGLRVGPRSTQDYFTGIAILDSSGNGVGAIFHTGDNTFAVIPITAGLYNGSPAQITSYNYGQAIGTAQGIWMRLTRVGNTWDAYASLTGNAWEGHVATTISKTITASRKCIGLFSATAIAAHAQITADWVHTV
jgi:hypothetical protein